MTSDLPNRVRLARIGRGLSQADLARAAGVTRQAIAGVESGRWDPSLKVALAIATVLQTGVDQLFGLETHDESPIEAEMIEKPSREGPARVQSASIGSRRVALSLSGDMAMNAGFSPASGVVDDFANGSMVQLRPVAPEEKTLVIAGCDPAIPLLSRMLLSQRDPVQLMWIPCGSERALELLQRGLVHVAGAHLFDPSSGEYNSPQARAALADLGAEVVGFAQWCEGLVVGNHIAPSVNDLSDAIQVGARLVNREKGSEARNVLDRELNRIGVTGDELQGYDTSASGHLMVASAIASGLADIGVASEAAAATYGQAFVPWVTERYDLVIPAPMMSATEVTALVGVLGSPVLRRQLAALPGYDASICGEVMDVF